MSFLSVFLKLNDLLIIIDKLKLLKLHMDVGHVKRASNDGFLLNALKSLEYS